MRFCTITVFCFLLCANCQSNKAKKDNDSALATNKEEIIEERDNGSNPVLDEDNYIEDGDCDDIFGSEIEEPEQTLEEQLNLISYKLDWTSLEDGCKPFIKKNGLHVIREPKNKELNGADTTMVNDFNGNTTDGYYYYNYVPGNRRFVLEEGKNIIYNPNITVDDISLIGIKECVIHLAAITMRSDPRIKDSDSFYDIIKEAWYYLLYKDEGVKQDIKKIAEEHYQVACNSYLEQGELQKVLKTSKMRLVFNPSRAKGIIIIEFDFDKNGYLGVRSAYVTDNKFDISNDGSWFANFLLGGCGLL